ncbi:hypothetical protein D3C78_1751080 [compost metagenome]
MQVGIQDGLGQRQLEHHEGEFAARRQHQPEAHRAALVQPAGNTADPVQQRQLDQQQQQGQADHAER